MEDGGSKAVALEDGNGAVALVSGLRLQRQRWALAAAEEHAIMSSASALSKPRASYYNVGISFGEATREDLSDARDVCWKQWQQDRHILAAVAVVTVQIRL